MRGRWWLSVEPFALSLRVPGITVGGELQWARRENHSHGYHPDGLRLQVSVKERLLVQVRELNAPGRPGVPSPHGS